jgi:ParB family chromosome partitioning protein
VNKPAPVPDAEIELTLIDTRKQVRTRFQNLRELAESFKQNGIIEPLVVHEEPDGRYRLIVGERRLRAAPLAGLDRVPVVIKRGLTELEIRRIQITENNDRENLSAFEEAQGVIEDVEQYGVKEAMAIWNRGEAWISKRRAVKRYAAPVRELLETDVCGDFEILHSLNQIYGIEDTHTEFFRLSHRLSDGLMLGRDEVRNTYTRMKTWKQQQAEALQQREEAERSQSASAAQEPQCPADVEPGVPSGAELPSPASADLDMDAGRKHAERALHSLRNEAFEWGMANQVQFTSLKTKMNALDYDLHNTEWVLWQGFLSMTLPMLAGIGPERASAYLKKLQGELKGKTPSEVWEALHPLDGEGAERKALPPMPEGWRF